MEKNLFQKTLMRSNDGRPPVWLMRQAGRYHSHYQDLRKKHSFIDLCKIPEIACETTLGPVRDFDFDAAILFSDLLFPLEVMGMALKYDPGPKLGHKLKTVEDAQKLVGGQDAASALQFQGKAMEKVRAALSPEKGLLGFVGGPLTLFCYAVDGSHKEGLQDSERGLRDGRFEFFHQALVDLLVANMEDQAKNGADAIAIMDTCAGEFTLDLFQKVVLPSLIDVMKRFSKRCPGFPVMYYSKGTGPQFWEKLRNTDFVGIGVDWQIPITNVLDRFSDRFVIQGNFDPNQLFLDPEKLEKKLRNWFESIKKLPPEKLSGWVCGLGHGVLPGTPEENVRLFVKLEREYFS